MFRSFAAPVGLGALLLLGTLAAPATSTFADGPASCVLSLATLDAQVAFTGSSRTVACRAALAKAGPSASIGYESPAGFPACIVLYAPSRHPATETEGAVVFDSGSGQASQLCDVYANTPSLYVYNVDGSEY
jgi:hypothetical protein